MDTLLISNPLDRVQATQPRHTRFLLAKITGNTGNAGGRRGDVTAVRRSRVAHSSLPVRRTCVPTRQQNVLPVIDSTFTTCMEQLQEGYVAAVAATAGCTLEPIKRDVYGTDVRIIRPGRGDFNEEVVVMAQLKNTTQVRPDPSKDFFSYQFKKRIYFEKLAMRRTTTKAILLVMATELAQADWSKSSHNALEVRNCCYFLNLEGETAAEGVQSPSVRIPTRNIFDADSLTAMLDRVERGEAI